MSVIDMPFAKKSKPLDMERRRNAPPATTQIHVPGCTFVIGQRAGITIGGTLPPYDWSKWVRA